MGYCTLSDLTTYGIPPTALGQITSQQQQAAIDGTAAYIDSKIRNRYPLPLAPTPIEIVRCNAILAAEEILTVRGWDPSNAGDDGVMKRAAGQRQWLDDVQRGSAHLNVSTANTTQSTYASPKIISSSTTSPFSGTTASNRSW